MADILIISTGDSCTSIRESLKNIPDLRVHNRTRIEGFPKGDFYPGALIISPGWIESCELSIKEVFLCLKELYPRLMQFKGCALWILEPDCPKELSPLNKGVFSEGVKSLTRLAAAELAKKKITVNYLAKGEKGFNNAENLINWSLQGNIFMTGQILNE